MIHASMAISGGVTRLKVNNIHESTIDNNNNIIFIACHSTAEHTNLILQVECMDTHDKQKLRMHLSLFIH